MRLGNPHFLHELNATVHWKVFPSHNQDRGWMSGDSHKLVYQVLLVFLWINTGRWWIKIFLEFLRLRLKYLGLLMQVCIIAASFSPVKMWPAPPYLQQIGKFRQIAIDCFLHTSGCISPQMKSSASTGENSGYFMSTVRAKSLSFNFRTIWWPMKPNHPNKSCFHLNPNSQNVIS